MVCNNITILLLIILDPLGIWPGGGAQVEGEGKEGLTEEKERGGGDTEGEKAQRVTELFSSQGKECPIKGALCGVPALPPLSNFVS